MIAATLARYLRKISDGKKKQNLKHVRDNKYGFSTEKKKSKNEISPAESDENGEGI